MEGVTVETVIGFASQVGGNAILLLIIVAMLRGWLVPKPFVDDIRKDRDEWKQVARGSTQVAAEGARTQAKATDVAQEASRFLAEVLRQQQEQALLQAQQGAQQQGTRPQHQQGTPT